MIKKNEKNRKGKSYLLYLMVILTIIYIVDEIASSMNSAMQPYVLIDLFKVPNGDILSEEYAAAVAKATLLSMPANAFMFLMPFYKSLADRFGRKPFLIINTGLMGLGLLVCFLSPSYYVYVVGLLMITFVQSNDMQVMYIMETAPAKHRAKLCSITKAIALAGVSLIGVCRSMFYSPSNLGSWRYVFIVPALLGIGVALCSIPFVDETPVFLEKKEGGEEMAAEEKKEEKGKDGGVIPAFKFMFRNRQMRSICFAGFVFCIATGVTNYYSTILEAAQATGKLTVDEVTRVTIIYPLVNALVTFFSVFISDRLGRKRSSIILSGIAALGLFMFIFGCRFGWGTYAVAIGYGVFIGGLWSVSDTLILVMAGESAPTELRASVYGANSMISGIGMVIGILVMVVGMNVVGSSNVGLLSLAATLPFILLAMIMMGRNIKETNGADLNEAGKE